MEHSEHRDAMIPSEPPWIVEIDGTQFAAPESVLLLLKAVSEERDKLKKKNSQARAIMQRFVDKVDSGLARSTETYAEMKQWMEEE